MRLTIKKDNLQLAVSAVGKLAVKPNAVILQAKNGLLNVIANTESYVRFSVPCEVEEEGTIGLQFSVFSDLLKLRKKTILLNHHKGENTLNVEGGSRVGVFILEATEDQYELPEKTWDSTIKMSSESIAVLRRMVNDVSFTYILAGENDQARLVNSEDGFTIQFADSAHCAFYEYKKPLSKVQFEFQSFIAPLRTILSFIDEKCTINVSESMLMFESEQLTATIAASQTGQIDYIKQSMEFIDDSYYSKGCVVFSVEDFSKVLESISVVSDDSEPFQFKMRDKRIRLKMKTVQGFSEDSLKIEKNSVGDLEQSLSLPLMRNVLDCCASIDDKITMSVSHEEKFYRLMASTENVTVKCLAPFTAN